MMKRKKISLPSPWRLLNPAQPGIIELIKYSLLLTKERAALQIDTLQAAAEQSLQDTEHTSSCFGDLFLPFVPCYTCREELWRI